MNLPPDPRSFDLSNVPALAAEAGATARPVGSDLVELTRRMRSRLEAGDDDTIREALRWQGPPGLSKALWEALQRALDVAPAEEALRLQLFALPLVVVAGTRKPARVAMTLRDVGAIEALFRGAGALGPNQQFGLNAGLYGERSLGELAWSALYRRARLQTANALPVELPAEDIALVAGQSVHLRFLAGSILLPAGAPGFHETAGDVGRWGADLTKELARQLATPDVTLLPLARTPQGLVAAWQFGRFCAEEVACQLAIGDHLRDLRARAGDPTVSLESIQGLGLGVVLESPWTGERWVHPWRLYPETSLPQVTSSVWEFLRDCGLPPATRGEVAQ